MATAFNTTSQQSTLYLSAFPIYRSGVMNATPTFAIPWVLFELADPVKALLIQIKSRN